MPEEKKKESFTFSDKIKQSKQAASKSFGNRITSKIGSDGKPHQTLFERTKRDAPFFIAALVALLLLPFLYKYSGQVEDEPTMVTPSYDDAILNPDRSGFDFTGTDPEGQIAQLSGRDSMDLIVGFGKRRSNEEEGTDSLDEIYRSGLSDSSANSSYARNDMDEETNIKNIYKLRKKAPAATRAAFKRAATKINKLGTAGMARGNGGRLGERYGGNMKNAANKVRNAGPQNSPKPVSLQPLQAAGKPSRSYFGGTQWAKEAQRSKDAMSKGNAMQALMDAQMRQPEPGQIGGIMGGDFGGPGGGNGNLHREFNYSGEKPWWWDLMKTRSQMQWERHFNRMWKYIDTLDEILLTVGKGLAFCLLTGDSGGDVDAFLGSGAGATIKEATCCGQKEARWAGFIGSDSIPFSEDACKGFAASHPEVCAGGWQGPKGNASDVRLGFFGQRFSCLGGNGAWLSQKLRNMFTAEKGDLDAATSCESFKMDGLYRPQLTSTEGKEDKWTTWVYVVGIPHNKVDKYYGTTEPTEQAALWTILYLRETPLYNAKASDVNIKGIPLFIESAAIYQSKIKDASAPSKKSSGDSSATQEEKQLRSDLSMWENKLIHATTETERQQCRQMITNIQTRLAQISRDQHQQKGTSGQGDDDAPQLNPATDEGMLYVDFMEKLRNGGIVVSRDAAANTPERARELSGGKAGKHWVTGGRCPYPLARISCDLVGKTDEGSQDGLGRPLAYLKSYGDMTDQHAYDQMKDRFVVSYTIQGQNNAPGNETESTITSEKTQWYPLGTQEFSKDNPATVAARHTVEKLHAQGYDRVIVSWQVRQCGDLLFSGNGVSKGGCNVGKLVKTDKDGNFVGYSGQSLPGNVVSEATCYYGDAEVVTKNPGTNDCTDGDIVKLPKQGDQVCEWAKKCERGKWSAPYKVDPNCQEPNPDDDSNPDDNPNPKGNPPVTKSAYFINSFKALSNRPLDPNERPDTEDPNRVASNKKWDNCKITDGTPLLKLDSETIAYFKAAKEKFDRENRPNGIALSYNDVGLTVPNLVDAILMDPNNGTVPKNTVCLLGKTIGGYAKAPANGEKGFDNLFGAFMAFITYDAASRPTQKTYDKSGTRIWDLRFSIRTPYWWGGYTEVGNRSYYVQQIDDPSSPWHGLPLNELEREKLLATSKTQLTESDNKNRLEFQRIYDDLTNYEPCKYAVGETVTHAKVLEYITRLCDHGDNVMPKADPRLISKYKGNPAADQAVATTGNVTPNIAPNGPGSASSSRH
ncbi:hypothetical protein [Candidatus Avelusimicrobium luingense]|uniref:hypothetical protein n=1 Tax=Candidatus Avelusimicrobium luingense TaxID=3416211 RepID=UPI003D0E13A3